MKNLQQSIIGRAEKVDIIGHSIANIPAKVDTGADISSVWASSITQTEAGDLEFCLFGPTSDLYSGHKLTVRQDAYRTGVFANSTGHLQTRYVVKLPLRILGRRVNVTCSLADRSSKVYPILLGRRLLNKKFLVDVSGGSPLTRAEQDQIRKKRIALTMDES